MVPILKFAMIAVLWAVLYGYTLGMLSQELWEVAPGAWIVGLCTIYGVLSYWVVHRIWPAPNIPRS